MFSSLFSRRRQTNRSLWVATAILLLMYGLALSSMVGKSPTFDEQFYITRGLAYLRGENQHLRVGHPLGLNALSAAFLVADDGVNLPVDDPSWQGTDFHRPSELFLWEIGNDVEHVMFLARLPMIWLGMLLAAVTGRWAWELAGNRSAGVLATALIAFDPNVLAHTRLATTDVGPATGGVVAGYALWRFLKRPSWSKVLFAGAAFGLLQNTKASAVLFIPLFSAVILLSLLHQWRGRVSSSRNGLRVAVSDCKPEEHFFAPSILFMSLVAYPVVAFLTLWAGYGFQVGRLPLDLTSNGQLSSLTLPLSHHLEQLLHILQRLDKSTPSFLLGKYSDRGWWYYFPVAFALKTPLATLVLLSWAMVRSVWKRLSRGVTDLHRLQVVDYSVLLIPALGFFAIALTSRVNLGYRYLLPVLPFLAVFMAVVLGKTSTSAVTLHISRLLVVLLAVTTIRIHPDYLAFFNVPAGGADNGWQSLVDSNIDWGQDIGSLKKWMDENEVSQVWLSYFGEARPEQYGIRYRGLDSYPPRLMNPAARPFYPQDPAPGIYAISVTNLQGVLFADHDQFSWFREREPLAKIGYSIFVYRVASRGEPIDLMLGGVQLDEIDAGVFRYFQTNDVTPHWFEPSESMLLRRNAWYLLSKADGSYPEWSSYISSYFEKVHDGDAFTLYMSKQTDLEFASPTAEFTNGSGRIRLLGDLFLQTASISTTFQLTTVWEQRSEPQPVKIFIHATGPDGTLVAQWDGLGAAWEGWRDGDILIQAHSLRIPSDAPGGSLDLWAGLYHPETGNRWQTPVGDRVYLGKLSVESGG